MNKHSINKYSSQEPLVYKKYIIKIMYLRTRVFINSYFNFIVIELKRSVLHARFIISKCDNSPLHVTSPRNYLQDIMSLTRGFKRDGIMETASIIKYRIMILPKIFFMLKLSSGYH